MQSYLNRYFMAGNGRSTSGGLYIYFTQQLPQTRNNLLICNHSAGEVCYALNCGCLLHLTSQCLLYKLLSLSNAILLQRRTACPSGSFHGAVIVL